MKGSERSRASELLRRMTEARHAHDQPPPSTDAVPALTAIQREMWLHEQLGRAGSAYTTLRAWRLRGRIDLEALERSVADIVERHDAFAMRIRTVAAKPSPIFERNSGWRGIEAELPQGPDPEVWLADRLSSLAVMRFDLERGPLFAVHLLLMAETDVVLVWAMHHLVSDDWSYSCIGRDLEHFYALHIGEDVSELPDLGDGYRGFLAAPRGDLHSTNAPEDLPRKPSHMPWPDTGQEREIEGDPARAAVVTATLDQEQIGHLKRAARSMGVTAYTLIAGVYQAMLARICDDIDVTIGVSRSVRLSEGDDAKVGMFVDHVDIPGTLAPAATLEAVARRVSDVLRQKPRAATTMAEITSARATLVYYAEGQVVPGLKNVRATTCIPTQRGLPVDLHLGVHPEEGGARLELSGRRSCFSRALLTRILCLLRLHLIRIGAEQAPGSMNVWTLPLFADDAERASVLRDAECEGDVPDGQTIATRFLDVARAHPEAPALISAIHDWTYRDLMLEADAVADWLVSLQLVPGDVVGLALPRGANLIRATMGALQAGLTIAPIDPDYPHTRRADMIATAGCRLVLAPSASDLPLATTLPPRMSEEENRTRRSAVARRPLTHDPDATAVIVFTSGSTGRPKGVMTTHRSILRLAAGLGPRRPGPGDRIAQIASPSFDGAFIEIFGSLLNGAALVTPEGPLGDHRDIARLLRHHSITKGFITAGLFNLILDHEPGAFETFDWLAIGGEAVSPSHAARFRTEYPSLDLVNAYGPTENGALTTSHVLDGHEPDLVPIGRPMPGNIALILGRDGTPVPHGFAGELWIGGPGLALGYVGLPDQTEAAFHTTPRHRLGLPGDSSVRLYATGDRVVQRENGDLCFNGRRDRQIKFSGFRLEPHEIEAAIQHIDGVQDAMVIVRTSPNDGHVTALEAGIVAAPELFANNCAQLRRHLREDLPAIMVPSRLVRVNAIPVTPNGKRDAGALAKMLADLRDPGSSAPDLDGVEPEVVSVWTEFVGPPRAGRYTDFFLSGGHSLGAMRMLAEIELRLDRRIPIADFFDAPTLGALSDLAGGTARRMDGRHLVLLRNGPLDRPPIIIATGMYGGCIWAREMVDALPERLGAIYGLNLDPADRDAIGVASLSDLAARMCDEIEQQFGRQPVSFVGYSFAGFLAFLLAAELERRGFDATRLILIDPNTNLLPHQGASDPPGSATSARLVELRSACRLPLISTGIDFIFCATAFPLPRLRDAEEWALLTRGGLRQFTLQTSHLAVIYGAWARLLARTVEGILDDSSKPDKVFDAALDALAIARIYDARDALLAGDTRRGRELAAALLDGSAQGLAAVHVLHARAVAMAGDLRGLKRLARDEMARPMPDLALLGDLSMLLRSSGDWRFARRVVRRLFQYSGPEVYGAFDLVAIHLALGQPIRARRVAARVGAVGRSPITGLLCRAAIARQRGQRGEAFDLILEALGRSDAGIAHFAAVLDRVLRPQDHVFGLKLIEGAEAQFKGADILGRLRRDWEAHAAAEKAPIVP